MAATWDVVGTCGTCRVFDETMADKMWGLPWHRRKASHLDGKYVRRVQLSPVPLPYSVAARSRTGGRERGARYGGCAARDPDGHIIEMPLPHSSVVEQIRCTLCQVHRRAPTRVARGAQRVRQAFCFWSQSEAGRRQHLENLDDVRVF